LVVEIAFPKAKKPRSILDLGFGGLEGLSSSLFRILTILLLFFLLLFIFIVFLAG